MGKLIAAGLVALCLAACGGGGAPSGEPAPPPKQMLVAEAFATAAEMDTAELRSNAGYSGNLPTSHAIQDAGKQVLLDFLFMLQGAGTQGRNHDKVADDAEQKLLQYVKDDPDLLVPGIRVLIVDELYWNPPDLRDSTEALQPQLEALRSAVALVRKHLPQASIGITVTPHAVFGRPNTMDHVKKAVALVDWVGTDPYWLGDPATLQDLHAWSRSFPGIARQANPAVETWFIAQAFKLAPWDQALFNSYIAEQLVYAEQYDNILFFGWQHTSELDPGSAGVNFPVETKRLYNKYLKSGY